MDMDKNKDLPLTQDPELPEGTQDPETPEGEEREHVEPDVEMLESELERERYRARYRNALQSTIFGLITVAALAVLICFVGGFFRKKNSQKR